ncbi:MAG: class I SAM-dependent methyltransferase [Alphaproteobacteria bacterium]|nr:class I SAM-dependent methyltransferase [Alphaproteobacteria bacterium]
MADSVTSAQKKSPAQAARDWIQRLHRWLMADEALAAEKAAPPVRKPATPAPTLATTVAGAEPSNLAGSDLNIIALLNVLWGEGWHLPLGDHMTTVMVRAFGLDSSMGVLDLTAGLGGAARKIAAEYNTYVTGLEDNSELVMASAAFHARHNPGKRATLAAYDPGLFKAEKRYDGIIARELFFRIKNKKDFAAQVAASLKPQGQMSWTDLVVTDGTPPTALEAWCTHEGPQCNPMLLSDVPKLWSIHGLEVRVSEDRTGHYADAITLGLGKLMQSLQGENLSPESRRMVLHEVDRWAQRMVAFSAGLRFYRFHALKR